MRWDSLFDDLESQLEREFTAEDLDLAAEEERLRLSRLGLRDRILVLSGGERPVTVQLTGGERLQLRLGTVGRDWVAADLGLPTRSQCILPLAAIATLSVGLADLLASLKAGPPDEPPGSLSARLGLPFVLRDLCRRRREVELTAAGGPACGTIDRVGRDHLDLAVHEAGTARRADAVSGYLIVPLAAIQLVRF